MDRRASTHMRIVVTLLAAALLAAGAFALASCGESGQGRGVTTAHATRPLSAAQQVQMMALGARVFTEHCHKCHTLFREPPPTPPHEDGAPDLDEVKPTIAYIHERINIGGLGMAMFSQEIPRREQEAVAFYVDHVAVDNVSIPRREQLDAAQLAEGERVFRANCQACHQIAGRPMTGTPRYPGIDFDKVRPSEALVQRRATLGLSVWMPKFRGKLTPAEIRAVARYVNATAGGRG